MKSWQLTMLSHYWYLIDWLTIARLVMIGQAAVDWAFLLVFLADECCLAVLVLLELDEAF